jgi:hypothetical protein
MVATTAVEQKPQATQAVHALIDSVAIYEKYVVALPLQLGMKMKPDLQHF